MRKDGVLENIVSERYASWDSGIGAEIESGKLSLADLEAYMLEKGDAEPNRSGRQEYIENLINDYIA